MYSDQQRLVVSPTDLVGFLACEHLTALSLRVVGGELSPPTDDDPEVELVRRRGNEHEARYLATLREAGWDVVEIGDGDPSTQAAATLRALALGPDVIYQATFFAPGAAGLMWRGHADFLSRVDRPSHLGAFSYEPEDTKLARHVRPSAVIQLCEYAEQLAAVQGVAARQIFVVLGGSERIALSLAEFSAYYRVVKREFERALSETVPTYPLPTEHCAVCSWREACDERRVFDDHLSLVAGLSSEQARRLNVAGVSTLASLAVSHGAVHGIANAPLARLRDQARLQLRARSGNGAPPHELLPAAGPGIGLGALPPPDAGDLFFDIEGDPYVGDGGIEYLLGVGWQEPDGSFGYRSFWAHTPEEEKRSFEQFIDFVNARRARAPGLHVYHYAPYEPSALGRLMGRYGTREAEVDVLLRDDTLVDLFRVVRQAVRVGTPSYSLKKLESLYRPPRTEAVTDAGSSIVEYERWLEAGDPTILDALREYNRIDCLSTLGLRDWLEARRDDYATTFGHTPSRPARVAPDVPPTIVQQDEENAALRRALRGESDGASLPMSDAATTHDPGFAAQALLGELLDWYRREDRPKWWQFYHRVFDCDASDLFSDTEAIAGLEPIGLGERVKRSVVHLYRFDPGQESKLSVGDHPCDPGAERSRQLTGGRSIAPGVIYSLDLRHGEVGLLRSATSRATDPESLIPPRPLNTAAQQEAVRRVARSVIADGIDGAGPYRALRDLLLVRPPRLAAGPARGALAAAGETARSAAVRIAEGLSGGYLAVQGPPGSGKTSLAAQIAVSLVRANKTVGVTANSHAVISNLLQEIVREAERRHVPLGASQKSGDVAVSHHRMITQRDSNDDLLDDLDTGTNVVAGTAWVFADAKFDQRLDCVIIDEAGQFSLANALAVGTAASNVVLVGDPRQLGQPSTGSHPAGAEVSALDHLLRGAETMPDDLGIFLDETHRLHPKICTFISEVVYEGRLHSDADCARQVVGGADALSGAGLRWLPVDHRGNRVSSPEEVGAVHSVIGHLLGRTFTDKEGAVTRLGLDDILVVAPFNAQVAALADVLPNGVRIGTVDKFQGQQAPVVVTSLATSDLSEIPRGMEFLYSRNRLNVAVSRAQALSILIGSPALLHVRCHSIEQMRLANGLCRYVELADVVELAGPDEPAVLVEHT